ncbi:hypothetical protein DVH05_002688 [Phytophthora capsici]|nr:hypothetical protein DVH05_002688 [Phytophthora capsici]
MIGSMICGHFSDLWGRKKLLFVNCIFMIVGAVVEAAVSNVWSYFAVRLIAGIASCTATGTLGTYTNELTPPHMRDILGLGLQISVTIGILFPAITFFFANTSSGVESPGVFAFPIRKFRMGAFDFVGCLKKGTNPNIPNTLF